MRVEGNRLLNEDGTAVAFQRSPNQGAELKKPRYLVMHYTAGRSAESSLAWLCDPAARASAHLLIGRDGEITQLVEFNRVAWHAGESRWQGLVGLNNYALGIEIDNAGVLDPIGDGSWKAWFGGSYPAHEVLVAKHKFDTVERGWHIYTEPQLRSAVATAAALVEHYGLLDVIGHDDIAPSRKKDPGPAFPMESVRSAALGRREDSPRIGTVTTGLNIRSGPGAHFAKLRDTPLKAGTKLTLQGSEGKWLYVELSKDGAPDLTGWVYGDYVRVS